VIRLLVTSEGPTERIFVKTILAPHLAQHNVFAESRCVLTSKDKRAAREFRGGLLGYEKVKADIVTWFKQDDHPECRYTTMFDLYGLPNDFPGYEEAKKKSDPYERVKLLENALADDIKNEYFIPYIQLHEFEALILADPQKLDWEYLEHDRPISNLVKMVGSENPELINDGPETAPSKRIQKEIPEFHKPGAGVNVVAKIGLQVLRSKCRHFNEWLTRLEKMAAE